MRTGLPPARGPDPRVLILGSFPGDRSLAERQYYAHPRNRLWPALAAVLDLDPRAAYEDRIATAHEAGIAFWDVLAACERRGSLDQAIIPGTEVPSDLGSLIEAAPSLRAILLNGGSVARLFDRFQVPRAFWPDAGLAIEVMPSTSPANAGVPTATVIARWAAALGEHLDRRLPARRRR